MKIQLVACNAAKPNRRAITKTLEEVGENVDAYTAREFTDILLDGTAVEIELSGKTVSSAFRALRKLEIDYEIED